MEEYFSSRKNIHGHHCKSQGLFGFHIFVTTLELKDKTKNSTQLKCGLLKKSKIQQPLPSFYTLHTFAEERFPTGAEKLVNRKTEPNPKKSQDHHHPDGQVKVLAVPQHTALPQSLTAAATPGCFRPA